jgi:L-lysine exporter family protein LysE/ArgO
MPDLPLLAPTAPFASFATGFTLGASLIMAIGAQNAFVLRQGLRREHVAAVVAVCAALDVALMCIGVSGLGAVLAGRPGWIQAATVAGALVLAWYSLSAFRRAFSPHSLRTPLDGAAQPARQVVAQALSISLLNPHVYLDTVLLVGSVGAQQAAGTQAAFLLGSGLSSTLWFAGLGLGARLLSPLFARPLAWRVLDALVGLTMAWIAFSLGADALQASRFS